jgi:hypothetical protein
MASRRSSSRPSPNQREGLHRCWSQECDIDPLILRARLLRHQGLQSQARAVEQEVRPLF